MAKRTVLCLRRRTRDSLSRLLLRRIHLQVLKMFPALKVQVLKVLLTLKELALKVEIAQDRETENLVLKPKKRRADYE
nr:MAG TPA: hypothetical protein [Caudoviricetes sp.]